MPPNRKGTFDAVDTLSTLNVSQFVETSKFAPLTSTSVAQQTDDGSAPVDVVSPSLQHLNDDPIKSATIERILKEERLRKLFSADHVIDTLIQRSEAKPSSIHREIIRVCEANTAEADEYWTESKPNESDMREAFAIRSKHSDAAYWEWKSPQEEKDALVQRILEEERVRQLFTIEHIEQSLLKDAAKLQQEESKSAELAPENDSYWSWNSKEQDMNDSDIVLQPEDKQSIIQEILEAEQLRQQFTVEHVEDIEMKGARNDCGVSRTVASNDDYWAGF